MTDTSDLWMHPTPSPNSHRNIWLSMALALPTVMVLYVLTNISYFTVMNKAALLSSNAVALVCIQERNHCVPLPMFCLR